MATMTTQAATARRAPVDWTRNNARAAGILYILRLMGGGPAEAEAEPPQAPIRSAGITPAAAVTREEER